MSLLTKLKISTSNHKKKRRLFTTIIIAGSVGIIGLAVGLGLGLGCKANSVTISNLEQCQKYLKNHKQIHNDEINCFYFNRNGKVEPDDFLPNVYTNGANYFSDSKNVTGQNLFNGSLVNTLNYFETGLANIKVTAKVHRNGFSSKTYIKAEDKDTGKTLQITLTNDIELKNKKFYCKTSINSSIASDDLGDIALSIVLDGSDILMNNSPTFDGLDTFAGGDKGDYYNVKTVIDEAAAPSYSIVIHPSGLIDYFNSLASASSDPELPETLEKTSVMFGVFFPRLWTNGEYPKIDIFTQEYKPIFG